VNRNVFILKTARTFSRKDAKPQRKANRWLQIKKKAKNSATLTSAGRLAP
jgi:hypothetical protein